MIEKLQRLLNDKKNELDAFALVPGPNFRHITGGQFFLMERPFVLIISKSHKPVAIVPVLEVSNFINLNFDAEIIEWQDNDGFQSAFNKAFKLLGNNFTLGIEGQLMRAFEMQAIMQASEGIKIKNAHKIISKIRLYKKKYEVENIRKAVDIAEQTLSDTINFVKEGRTEIEIKKYLMQKLLEFGANDIAFEPLVLAGSNSALCHGHSRDDYQIKKGDCILFDFGANVNGYNSDITRTFFLGSVNEENRNMYDVVYKANSVGRKVSKPGISMHDLDDNVMKILEASNFKQYIVHKTGHGLGMDVHEDPYIMRKNYELLEEGMVITIEPGLYKENHLGIRIEDDVLITNNSCESLTTFSRELKII
mgnify:FL=1